jgi:hypothetical protein
MHMFYIIIYLLRAVFFPLRNELTISFISVISAVKMRPYKAFTLFSMVQQRRFINFNQVFLLIDNHYGTLNKLA